MSTSRIFADVFVSPARGLAAAAERKSILPPILVLTVVSILFAAVLVPRVDWESVARTQLDMVPGSAQLTPHEVEEKVATVRKLGAVSTYGGAAVGSAAMAVIAAFFLWLGLRLAGARPVFLPTLAVASWSLLPGALARLLLVPALLAHPAVDPRQVGAMAPWSVAWFLPAGTKPQLMALATSANLFSLWIAVLLAIGMAHVAQVSRARAGTVVGVLWALATALQMLAAGAAGAAGA